MRVQPMGADTLQISWRPPVNPNGLITSYEITYQLVSRGMCDNNQDAPRTVSISGTSYVLNGLYPHSKYRQGYAALKRRTILMMNAFQSWCGCEDTAGRRTSQSGNTDRPSIARRISCLSENRGCEGDRGHSQLAGTALSAGMRAFIQMAILKDHLLKYLVSNAIRCVFYARDILAKTWALG